WIFLAHRAGRDLKVANDHRGFPFRSFGGCVAMLVQATTPCHAPRKRSIQYLTMVVCLMAQPGDRNMIRVAFIIGDYPPQERRLREETAKSFSSAEVEVGIVSVTPSPFGGLTPAEIQLVAPSF